MAYVDFGYGDWQESITRDGELLATLGFTVEQYEDRHFSLNEAFIAAGGELAPHSGYSFSCARNVAAVLVKHGWKTVDDIPVDHPLHERVITGESAEKLVYAPEVE